MFTGIIQKLATISGIEDRPFGKRLVVFTEGWLDEAASGGANQGQGMGVGTGPRPVAMGDSICINGVCLTVADQAPGHLGFDVVRETLSRTALGELRVGSRVNLEPSLTAHEPLGGHFVQGHVEGVGQVVAVQEQPDWRIRIEVPAALMPCIVPKGSVAIDGVSMTIASVDGSCFEVAVIPTTLELTTLGSYRGGERVNLETDIIARTVVHFLSLRESAAPQAST